MNKQIVSNKGYFHSKIMVNGGFFYGNYSQDTDECYLVYVNNDNVKIHDVIISVLTDWEGELRTELYDGYDREIVRQILQLGHLTNGLKAKLPSDVIKFFTELCN